MDPFYLSKLQTVFTDFFLGILSIKPEHMNEESRTEWINLNNSFSYQKYHRYPEHVIISENTSALLHKYMLIICVDKFLPNLTKYCPGCYWLLSFIDAELAKRKTVQPSFSPAVNPDRSEALLARMQSLLN
jgi:hypothetical protein